MKFKIEQRLIESTHKIRTICGFGSLSFFMLLSSGCAAPAAVKAAPLAAAPALAWPVPVVGWSASSGKTTRANTPLSPGTDTLIGSGSSPELNSLQIVGSGDPKRSSVGPVYLLRPTGQPAALALAGLYSAPEQNPVLQSGSANSSLAALDGNKLTLFIEFKLLATMAKTGNPKAEEDGQLLSLGPDVSLWISGRGREGKTRRLPYLRVKEKTADGQTAEATYTAHLDDELPLSQWVRLALTWDGSETGEKRVTFAVNGAARPVIAKNAGLAAPVQLKPTAPILIGGNRAYNNSPIHLGAFAIYNQIFPLAQLQKLDHSALGISGASVIKELPQYENLAQLNAPEAWQTPDAPLSIEAVDSNILHASLANSKTPLSVLRLKNAIALDSGVKSVNFWVCQPPGGNGAVSLIPLFEAEDGTEIEGPSQLFYSQHSLPPNGRKSGLWFYRFTDLPAGARKFVGFKFRAEDSGAVRENDPTDSLFIKNIGLERIDYARASLYYVVGNYRDNFSDATFNNMGARALTETSGGAAQPYILLDNVVDQAKAGRPKTLDLQLDAYDTADRRVWSSNVRQCAAQNVPDFFHPITVPITQPGTYRIRGKSYNSETGEYFTTDWTKLVVLKGKSQTLTPQPQSDLLEINANKPFGRLEKTDPRQIDFSFGDLKSRSGPMSLRYAVIPYDEDSPFTRAKREVDLSSTRELSGATTLTLPYEPKRTVELIVAELWQNDKCIEHVERPIGIANALDKAPAFTIANQVPTLQDLAGQGKVWKTITIVSNPGADRFADVERNIGEAKKLTKDVGFQIVTPRLIPMPGVYDWDALKPYLDLAAKNGCRAILYLNQKWPPEWAPVEWSSDASGEVHRAGILYSYMVGKSVYATGKYGPEILRNFNQQLARRFLNHPGLGAYYFENEHFDIQWEKHPPSRSYHESFRLGFVGFVKRRYTTIDKLNQTYGTAYKSFDEVRLPDAENEADFPRKVMFVDFRLFQHEEVEKFVLRDQFDTARAEDPRRPILVYTIGEESFGFLSHIAQNGGMMANGGVHSDVYTDSNYERANAVPGLLYRMEPHDVDNYDPIPHGFDEMIFGMLGMGGRGLNAHIFLHGRDAFNYEKAIQPGQRTGFDKLIAAEPMLRELSATEKLHDPIGILELRTQGPFEGGIWEFHGAAYLFSHFNPRTVPSDGNLSYLDGSKLISIGRNTIDAGQLAYLTKFVQNGGKLVMETTSAQFALENPDAPGHNALLDALGVDSFADGTKLDGVAFSHDVYNVGKGQVLVARGAPDAEAWEKAMPSVTKWAGITERLANSGDRFMQIHVLENKGVFYLATTHRGRNQGFPQGPTDWEGQVQFLKPLNGARYEVTEMMSGKTLGIFTPAQLAAGFEAGKFEELQMKIFKIAPA